MITEVKTLELKQKRFIEYFKTRGRFKKVETLSDRACFIYWLNGKNKLFTGNDLVTTKGKDCLLLRCGAYINELLPEDDDGIELVVIHFYPEILKAVFHHEFPATLQNTARDPLPISLGYNELIEKYVEGVLLLFRHPEIVDDDLLMLKLKELVLLLRKTAHRQTIEKIFSYLFSQQEISFQQLIEAHLYSDLSVKELAYLASRSVATFKRDFQKYYNTSPALYMKNKKLEKAEQLLQHTELRIGEIVFECGFTNTSHFTTLFHKKYHVSPSTFRLSQTGKSLSQITKTVC